MNNTLTLLISPLSILLLAGLTGHAQDTLPSSFSHDSAIHATRIYGHGYPRLVYNANGQNLGRRDVLRRLELYSEPAGELRSYRHARAGFFIVTTALVATTAATILESSHHHSGAAWALGGGTFFALIGRFSLQTGAAMHFRWAIHIYNRRFEP